MTTEWNTHSQNGPAQSTRIGEGSILTLERIERHQAGIYQCTADNGVGEPVVMEMKLDILCKYTIWDGLLLDKLIIYIPTVYARGQVFEYSIDDDEDKSTIFELIKLDHSSTNITTTLLCKFIGFAFRKYTLVMVKVDN